MHAAVEDTGRYTCIVSNSAGEERKNFDLDILGKEILGISEYINNIYVRKSSSGAYILFNNHMKR